MEFNTDVLRHDERAVMALRTLYTGYGYTLFRMRRFEQYGMYADNKSFLASQDIITFNDASGRLMALRPDVTLSIVRSVPDSGGLKRFCYNENVYRPDGEGREFREHMQAGLECIGEIDTYVMAEVIMLALESLKTLGGTVCLDISHMGITGGVLDSAGLTGERKSEFLRLMSEKNTPELAKRSALYGLSGEFCENIKKLALMYGSFDDLKTQLLELCGSDDTRNALSELESLFAALDAFGVSCDIKLDFSIINDLNYYSGVIYQGFIEGIPRKILSGGRYDELLHKFGKKSGAIGFAVYLDLLERLYPRRETPPPDVVYEYKSGEGADKIARKMRGFRERGLNVTAVREGTQDPKGQSLGENLACAEV